MHFGKTIVVGVRGDGNCFFTSETTGVLLWAVCQRGARDLEDVLLRFKTVIEYSCRAAFMDLPCQLRVRIPTGED